MIITLKGANFSESKIGTLDTWTIFTTLGRGATYSGDKSVDRGAAFSGTVTLADGYEVSTAGVTVTMGGTTLTNAVTISGSTITISISAVTGTVYISVPTVNTSTGEEDIVGSYWIAEKLTGGTIGSGSATSMLNTQWFYIDDADYVAELAGKTVESIAFCTANKTASGNVTLSLVDLSNPVPSAWEDKITFAFNNSNISTIATVDLETPFAVPSGYTIGYRSSVGNIFGGGYVIAGYKRTEKYYNSSTATSASPLNGYSPVDFKVKKS